LIDRSFIFDLLNTCAVIFVIYLISSFILQVIQKTFDSRLKLKIIEKETTEPVVTQLLKPNIKDKRKEILQWIFLLAAIGTGFTVIHLSRPFGLHSLAIMAFSIAAGLGGYYYFSRQTDIK
ncbi:MAG TPA: hypothetical protein VGO09_03430, partial [Flavisolibacter sp.]|nr:hypothetical protein [Flavisolibacter sp.]